PLGEGGVEFDVGRGNVARGGLRQLVATFTGDVAGLDRRCRVELERLVTVLHTQGCRERAGGELIQVAADPPVEVGDRGFGLKRLGVEGGGLRVRECRRV